MLIDWALVGQRARTSGPKTVAPKTLEAYAGQYGDRRITLEQGTLVYQRRGPRLRLVPLTDTLFGVEGADSFRIEFTVKGGKAIELVGLYGDGRREPSARVQ